jgi:hypothetical protein
MSKQQTALNWLIDRILYESDWDGDIEYKSKYLEHINLAAFVIRARRMDKKQLLEVWNNAIESTQEGGKTFEETYGEGNE